MDSIVQVCYKISDTHLRDCIYVMKWLLALYFHSHTLVREGGREGGGIRVMGVIRERRGN